MNQYETGFILAPNLSEEETSGLINQMAEVVASKKGKLLKQDLWGKRKLAYQIKRFHEGYYVFFTYEGTPAVPAELERKFKQTDAILRFLTIKKDSKDVVRGKKKLKAEEPAAVEKVEAAAQPEEISPEEVR